MSRNGLYMLVVARTSTSHILSKRSCCEEVCCYWSNDSSSIRSHLTKLQIQLYPVMPRLLSTP